MARTKFMGIEEARRSLGDLVKGVQEEGDRVVLTRHGKPAALIVQLDGYRLDAELTPEPAEVPHAHLAQ